jgi:hypothetical protein
MVTPTVTVANRAANVAASNFFIVISSQQDGMPSAHPLAILEICCRHREQRLDRQTI